MNCETLQDAGKLEEDLSWIYSKQRLLMNFILRSVHGMNILLITVSSVHHSWEIGGCRYIMVMIASTRIGNWCVHGLIFSSTASNF